MKPEKHASALAGASYERRMWMVAALVSLVINVGLLAGLLSQKTVVQTTFIPPQLNQPFVLNDATYSNSYVEQVTSWFLSLVLNYTPASFQHQMITFSKHIDPALYGELRKTLRKELDEIRRQNRSSTFFIQKIRIRGLTALITGIRRVRVGNTDATEEQQHWFVRLNQRRDGLVTLSEFKQVDESALKAWQEANKQ